MWILSLITRIAERRSRYAMTPVSSRTARWRRSSDVDASGGSHGTVASDSRPSQPQEYEPLGTAYIELSQHGMSRKVISVWIPERLSRS